MTDFDNINWEKVNDVKLKFNVQDGYVLYIGKDKVELPLLLKVAITNTVRENLDEKT